jgi:hypothetical protein
LVLGLLSFVGCENNEKNSIMQLENKKTQTADVSVSKQNSSSRQVLNETYHEETKNLEQKTSIEMELGKTQNETVTPYQFLSLLVGNAENITIEYSVLHQGSSRKDTGAFYKAGEKFAAVFTVTDMNGKPVTVRELEMDGRVHYIMEETKTIKSYTAPAEDFLIYEMLKAAASVLLKSYEQDGFGIYEYSLPFDQDEETNREYRFFMKDGLLKKLEYGFNNEFSETFEFSGYSQRAADERIFEYPAGGYSEEWFQYPYTGENMPPWWENK